MAVFVTRIVPIHSRTHTHHRSFHVQWCAKRTRVLYVYYYVLCIYIGFTQLKSKGARTQTIASALDANKYFRTDRFYFAKRLFLFVAKVHVDFEDNDVRYILLLYSSILYIYTTTRMCTRSWRILRDVFVALYTQFLLGMRGR